MATNIEIFNELLNCLKYLIETTVENIQKGTKKNNQISIQKKLKETERLKVNKKISKLKRAVSIDILELKYDFKLTLETMNINLLNSFHHQSQLNSNGRVGVIFRVNYLHLVNFCYAVKQFYSDLKESKRKLKKKRSLSSNDLKITFNLSTEQANLHSDASCFKRPKQMEPSQKVNKYEEFSLKKMSQIDYNSKYMSFDLIDPTQAFEENRTQAFEENRTQIFEENRAQAFEMNRTQNNEIELVEAQNDQMVSFQNDELSQLMETKLEIEIINQPIKKLKKKVSFNKYNFINFVPLNDPVPLNRPDQIVIRSIECSQIMSQVNKINPTQELTNISYSPNKAIKNKKAMKVGLSKKQKIKNSLHNL